MIEIYHGNGKGKTSAAVGAAVRAAGYGVPVVFCEFLKDGFSGEVSVLEKIPGIFVILPEFLPDTEKLLSKEDEARLRAENANMLKKAIRLMTMLLKQQPSRKAMAKQRMEEIGVVKIRQREAEIKALFVFDEVLDAVNLNLMDRIGLLRFLSELPIDVEVILTGQDPDVSFLSMADYVTNMVKERHPSDFGQDARWGVEK